MRALFIFAVAILNIPCYGQLQEGFVKEEARDMIAICNSFTFIDLYGSDEAILPSGYKKKYTSGVFGMDNKYQIYQKGNVAIINLRGSTAKKMSWLENIHSSMIPAKGTMKIEGENFDYAFAVDTSAAVHSGYALGIAFLAKDLLYHIEVLNQQNVFDFIITGHSQGGALANMLRAYLENLPSSVISEKNRFKTYAFAAPKVGNKAFSEEYNARFCVNSTSFNIVNPADPIHTFPLSYNESLSDNFKSMLSDKEFTFKKLLTNSMALLFEDNLSNYVKMLSASASKQITKELGPVTMPPFVEDINYYKLNNRIELKPVAYPKYLRDSTILQNDSLMAIYQRGPDGHFVNKELYAKESWTYQHKPYNYYVSFLEIYFPKEYALLEKKYLMENL